MERITRTKAIRTKERILRTALTLFNEEGESSVGLVDVAAEMGISPGNLYYHYKGKEPLLEALYTAFEEEIMMVLKAPERTTFNLEDNWVFLYIIFEEIYDFRFFYLNVASIMERVPTLSGRFAKLMQAKEATIAALIDGLVAEDILKISEEQRRLVSKRSAMLFTFWLPQAEFSRNIGEQAQSIHEGVYTIFSQITPYMEDAADEFERLLKNFHDRMIRA